MIYAFEIEFDVEPENAQPLLSAIDQAIEASKAYKSVVHFGRYEKFEAVRGQTPVKKVVFLQAYSSPDGNQQHFTDPVVQKDIHPVFNQYPSKVYHYTQL